MDSYDPGPKSSHGPMKEGFLGFRQAFQWDKIDWVIDYLEVRGIKTVQECFHFLYGRDGVFSCNGFDTDYGRTGFCGAQEPFKGVAEEVKGFRIVGIRMEGTIDTSVACFRSDNGAAEIPDKAEVFFEPCKVLVTFVRIGMNGIDIATKNGDGNPAAFKDLAESAGVTRAQGPGGAGGIGKGL